MGSLKGKTQGEDLYDRVSGNIERLKLACQCHHGWIAKLNRKKCQTAEKNPGLDGRGKP